MPICAADSSTLLTCWGNWALLHWALKIIMHYGWQSLTTSDVTDIAFRTGKLLQGWFPQRQKNDWCLWGSSTCPQSNAPPLLNDHMWKCVHSKPLGRFRQDPWWSDWNAQVSSKPHKRALFEILFLKTLQRSAARYGQWILKLGKRSWRSHQDHSYESERIHQSVDQNRQRQRQSEKAKIKKWTKNVDRRKPDATEQSRRSQYKSVSIAGATQSAGSDPVITGQHGSTILTRLHDSGLPWRIPHPHFAGFADHLLQIMLEISRHEGHFHCSDGPTFRILSDQWQCDRQHLRRRQHLWDVPSQHQIAHQQIVGRRSDQHVKPLLCVPTIHIEMLPWQKVVCELHNLGGSRLLPEELGALKWRLPALYLQIHHPSFGDDAHPDFDYERVPHLDEIFEV